MCSIVWNKWMLAKWVYNFLASSRFPFLNTGQMLAVFQFNGNLTEEIRRFRKNDLQYW